MTATLAEKLAYLNKLAAGAQSNIREGRKVEASRGDTSRAGPSEERLEGEEVLRLVQAIRADVERAGR